jgi:hypothetical protein
LQRHKASHPHSRRHGARCGRPPKDILIEDRLILAIDNPGFGVSDHAEVISADDRMLMPGLIIWLSAHEAAGAGL